MQLGLSPYSTRHKPKSIDKEKSVRNLNSHNTANFFKKKSTDENEKNYLNYMDRIAGNSGHLPYTPSGNGTSSKINLNKKNDKNEKPLSGKGSSNSHFLKKKTSLTTNTKNLQIHQSMNTLKTPTSAVSSSLKLSTGSAFNVNTANKENIKENKQKSVKNLKLSSSIEFPKFLAKSVSQTTMNKKTD